MYPWRGISPTLRSGPRQAKRPLDASADEIIRFVREHQRSDPGRQGPTAPIRDTPDSTTSRAGLKKKSVLPAIGDRTGSRASRAESVSTFASFDQQQDRLQPPPSINVSVSVSDSGFVDKPYDVQDSTSEENYSNNESSSYPKEDYLHPHYNDNDDDDDDDDRGDNEYENNDNVDDYENDEDDDLVLGLQPVSDPFKYKQGVTILRGRNGSVLDPDLGDHELPLNPHNVFAEDQLVSSRTRRSSKILDNLFPASGQTNNNRSSGSSFLAGNSSSYLSMQHQHPAVSGGHHSNFSNGVSRSGKLMRPRALPQLPPIAKNKLPARPSAPSPSLTPPSPRSPVNFEGLDDEFEDEEVGEEEDEEDVSDNIGLNKANGYRRHGSAEPVDFIDCP